MKKPNEKIKNDTRKQLFYELVLKSELPNSEIDNQFVVPFFDIKNPKHLGEPMEKSQLSKEFSVSEIQVFKVNFNLIQRAYIEND